MFKSKELFSVMVSMGAESGAECSYQHSNAKQARN
jgi:hypothetical protein